MNYHSYLLEHPHDRRYQFVPRICAGHHLSASLPGQNGRHFADDISKWIFLNDNLVSWYEFRRSLFLRVQLTITEHWFKLRCGAWYATIHYLNQCWFNSSTHRCGTRGRWVKVIHVMGNECNMGLRFCSIVPKEPSLKWRFRCTTLIFQTWCGVCVIFLAALWIRGNFVIYWPIENKKICEKCNILLRHHMFAGDTCYLVSKIHEPQEHRGFSRPK